MSGIIIVEDIKYARAKGFGSGKGYMIKEEELPEDKEKLVPGLIRDFLFQHSLTAKIRYKKDS